MYTENWIVPMLLKNCRVQRVEELQEQKKSLKNVYPMLAEWSIGWNSFDISIEHKRKWILRCRFHSVDMKLQFEIWVQKLSKPDLRHGGVGARQRSGGLYQQRQKSQCKLSNQWRPIYATLTFCCRMIISDVVQWTANNNFKLTLVG
jgi:hypothetical protein